MDLVRPGLGGCQTNVGKPPDETLHHLRHEDVGESWRKGDRDVAAFLLHPVLFD